MVRLKEKRMEKQLSQEELSELSGVSQQTISSIESMARKNPGANTLYALAVALGTTMDELYAPDAAGETV